MTGRKTQPRLHPSDHQQLNPGEDLQYTEFLCLSCRQPFFRLPDDGYECPRCELKAVGYYTIAFMIFSALGALYLLTR